MPTNLLTPFSARSRKDDVRIFDQFPDTALVGLLHIVSSAIDRDYVPSWAAVAKEVSRIARIGPHDYNSTSVAGIREAKEVVKGCLQILSWDRVYDFCERLHSHLTQEAFVWRDEDKVLIRNSESQAFVAEEMQRLFEEEGLGYEFRDGFVQRRGKQHTISRIDRAQATLENQKLNSARTHFSKSLRYFRDRKHPDFENAVKEAVCAIEAAAKELFPDSKAKTLGDFLGWAAKRSPSPIPKPIDQTFSGLYGFRNSGKGVSHGAASGGVVTSEICEYVIAVAASQIILLADLAEKSDEPPF